MGTINFNINKTNNLYVQNKENTNTNIFAKGNLIEGTITYKDENTVKVSANNITLNLKASEVTGNLEDKVKFEVVGNENSSYILKQVKNITTAGNLYYSEVAEKMSNDDILEMLKKSNYVKTNDNGVGLSEEEMKEQQLLIEVQRALKYGTKNISGNLLSKVQAQGLSLDKISMSTLSQIIGEESVVAVKDKTREEMAQLKKDFQENLPTNETEIKSQIATALNDSGYAVTEENINSTYDSFKKLSNIQNNSQNIDIKNILQKELPLTQQVLQKNTHQKASELTNTTEVNETLEANILKRLKSLGIDTTENLEMAKTFVSNDIPLTKENIEKYNFLLNELSSLSKEDLINLALKSSKNEIPVEELDIQGITTTKIDSNIANLLNTVQTSNISDETYLYLDENNIDFTIKNLLENQQESTSEDVTLSKDALVQKRYFLEAQLKLTLENISTLNKNGINVSTTNLQKLVESLKNYEKEYATTNFNQLNITPTTEQVSLFTETTNYINELKFENPQVISKLLESSDTVSLSKIKPTKSFLEDYQDQMDWQLSKTSEKSNFKKVEGQIEELLDKLSIPKTEDNIASVGILIRNNMDVTDTSVAETSELLKKINYIKDEVTPKVITKMLDDGVNPLEESLDDLISYTESFKEVYGESNNDKLINELVKMKKDKTTNDDTKDAVKSIYKALNIISKNGIASVGSMIKEEKDLTLENLLSTAKNFDKYFSSVNTFDKTLSDDTTYTTTSSTVNQNLNISSITQKAVKYNKNALDIEEFIANADYEGLKNYIEENQEYLKELLPMITMKLKKNSDTTDIETVKELTENIANVSSETLSYLLKNKITLSRNNINTYNELEKDENLLSKNLSELNEKEDSGINLGSQLDESLPLDIASGTLLDVAIGEVTNSDFENIDISRKTVNLLEMQSYLNSKDENYYSFPIKLDLTGEVTNVNMFLADDNALEKDNVKIHFSLFTNTLKDLTVDAEIDKVNKNVSLEINCSSYSASLIEKEEDTFKDLLAEIGYEDVSITYNNGDTINSFKGLRGNSHGK
ncbi:MAG: DUF6240 domain-containing protein [Lachnospirales bacterium]